MVLFEWTVLLVTVASIVQLHSPRLKSFMTFCADRTSKQDKVYIQKSVIRLITF